MLQAPWDTNADGEHVVEQTSVTLGPDGRPIITTTKHKDDGLPKHSPPHFIDAFNDLESRYLDEVAGIAFEKATEFAQRKVPLQEFKELSAKFKAFAADTRLVVKGIPATIGESGSISVHHVDNEQQRTELFRALPDFS